MVRSLCSQELLVTPTLCTTATGTGTPHQQGPHLDEIDFLLPIALHFCVYRLVGAMAGMCLTCTVRITYRFLLHRLHAAVLWAQAL